MGAKILAGFTLSILIWGAALAFVGTTAVNAVAAATAGPPATAGAVG